MPHLHTGQEVQIPCLIAFHHEYVGVLVDLHGGRGQGDLSELNRPNKPRSNSNDGAGLKAEGCMSA